MRIERYGNIPLLKLVLSASGPNFHEAPLGQGIKPVGRDEFVGLGAPMALLVDWLSMQLGRKVVDKTMLTGNYDFTLHFQAGDPWPSESKSAAILAAVPRDLGLQLKPQVGPVEVIIVDHAEQVSANH